MPRGPILLIPLNGLRDFVLGKDKDAFKRDTIDIFVRFDEKRIAIVYKNAEKDVTDNAIQSFQ